MTCETTSRPLFWSTLALLAATTPAIPVVWAQAQDSPSLSKKLIAEPIETLANDARQNGDAVRGAIVFTQQNLACTKCHVAGAANPIGPDLNLLTKETSDVYFVESLLAPSKSIRKGFGSTSVVTTAGKVFTGRLLVDNAEQVVLQQASGTLEQLGISRSEIEQIVPSDVSTMPANLVDQLSSRQQFLDLVRYLMTLAATERTSEAPAAIAPGKSAREELQGLVLVKDLNCAACHTDDVTASRLGSKQAPKLAMSIGRLNPEYVAQFVADPQTTKPGTTMPLMLGNLSEAARETAATEITHYLYSVGERASSDDAAPAPEAEPESEAESETEAVSRGNEAFHTVGCAACHSPKDKAGNELLAESSVPLGPVHQKYHFDGLVEFLKNPLSSRPSGRMPQMKLTHWEAEELASYLLNGPNSGGINSAHSANAFTVDSTLAAKGKTRFGELGCVQCHSIDSSPSKPIAVSLSQARPDQGCLSNERGNWPSFALSDSQRTLIRTALSNKSDSLTVDDEIDVALTANRCVNCHQRGDLGGVTAERDLYFHTTNPNLGPQGRIPPTLTGVGAKLKPQWMRQVLVSGRAIRPYVLTRMPQYGVENVAYLTDLFQQADSVPPVQYPVFDDQKEIIKVGEEMAGTAGLNCIVCHTYRLEQAANMPAVDLTEMAERLHKDWFTHYMRDPQSLSRNTIMPSFWPGGRAMRQDILGGDRDRQIEALWQYLLDGRQARPPRGLIQEPMELLATDEAVMLRRSYPEIGKRGIGVGYPQQVNIAFDAEQMRLAMIWQGKFADPGGVWRSQGHGRVRTLGERPIIFAPGPDLDSATDPWIVDDTRPPLHQFKGYSLDSKRRPRFRYLFDDVAVEDYFVDKVDQQTEEPFLVRTLALTSSDDRDDVSLRVATGKAIRAVDGGRYAIDDGLIVDLGETTPVEIRTSGELQELRIPLKLTKGSTYLAIEYRW